MCFIFQCCNTVVKYYRNGIKNDTRSSRRRTRFSHIGGHHKCVITWTAGLTRFLSRPLDKMFEKCYHLQLFISANGNYFQY